MVNPSGPPEWRIGIDSVRPKHSFVVFERKEQIDKCCEHCDNPSQLIRRPLTVRCIAVTSELLQSCTQGFSSDPIIFALTARLTARSNPSVCLYVTCWYRV